MAFPGGRALGQGLLGAAHRDGGAEMGDIKKPSAALDSSSACKTAGAEILWDTLEAKKNDERCWGPGMTP